METIINKKFKGLSQIVWQNANMKCLPWMVSRVDSLTDGLKAYWLYYNNNNNNNNNNNKAGALCDSFRRYSMKMSIFTVTLTMTTAIKNQPAEIWGEEVVGFWSVNKGWIKCSICNTSVQVIKQLQCSLMIINPTTPGHAILLWHKYV